MDKETFFLGESNVTIENPNRYLKKAFSEDEFSLLVEKVNQEYTRCFRSLAYASRDFYHFETNFSIQKELVETYLEQFPCHVISKQTTVSYTVVNQLKNRKRLVGSVSLEIFEKLYKGARQSVN